MDQQPGRHRAVPPQPLPRAVIPAGGRALAAVLITASPDGVPDAVLGVAAEEFGTTYALEGESLDVCLRDLDATLMAIDGMPAPPDLVRRAALAWGDAVQRHYTCLTCADPLTGLATLHHLQAQVADLYRAAADGHTSEREVSRTHGLVVIELASGAAGSTDGAESTGSTASLGALEDAMRRAAAADLLEQQLPACGTAAEVTPRRLVALARRSPELNPHLDNLSAKLDERLSTRCRMWVEELPLQPADARELVAALAR
ncbi:hypothetical protein ACFQ0K_08820 [Nocardioides caeni]|uniref:Uncharacterized protein n=1 Tax=Nocardioides caeni TaxID=574700 RepID=A0A4V4HJG8_9ACTN|nr:hypothetical protein [Nocardioides caeni]THV10496.1 hypothetical protein E9934_14315 [Nocardioides caeni]